MLASDLSMLAAESFAYAGQTGLCILRETRDGILYIDRDSIQKKDNMQCLISKQDFHRVWNLDGHDYQGTKAWHQIGCASKENSSGQSGRFSGKTWLWAVPSTVKPRRKLGTRLMTIASPACSGEASAVNPDPHQNRVAGCSVFDHSGDTYAAIC
jgi:hypothetical protein